MLFSKKKTKNHFLLFLRRAESTADDRWIGESTTALLLLLPRWKENEGGPLFSPLDGTIA